METASVDEALASVAGLLEVEELIATGDDGHLPESAEHVAQAPATEDSLPSFIPETWTRAQCDDYNSSICQLVNNLGMNLWVHDFLDATVHRFYHCNPRQLPAFGGSSRVLLTLHASRTSTGASSGLSSSCTRTSTAGHILPAVPI